MLAKSSRRQGSNMVGLLTLKRIEIPLRCSIGLLWSLALKIQAIAMFTPCHHQPEFPRGCLMVIPQKEPVLNGVKNPSDITSSFTPPWILHDFLVPRHMKEDNFKAVDAAAFCCLSWSTSQPAGFITTKRSWAARKIGPTSSTWKYPTLPILPTPSEQTKLAPVMIKTFFPKSYFPFLGSSLLGPLQK